jgi:hypothetical protein
MEDKRIGGGIVKGKPVTIFQDKEKNLYIKNQEGDIIEYIL